MLLVFRSKAAAEFLMLSQHAAPVLQAAGKAVAQGVPERGVFTPAQLPAAIAGIAQAIAQETVPVEADEDESVHPMAQAVSLRQRAWPLHDMLRRAQAKGVEVLWEPAPVWM